MERFRIILNINQQLLQGWFVKAIPVNKAPLIIYYGGNAEDISINLSYLLQAQAPSSSWLFINYRGFGNSSGKPSQSGLYEDALAIYDYLILNSQIPLNMIFLMGRSIGSSIASYVASQRQVAGLILVTPFDSIASFIPKILKFSPFTSYFEKYFNTQKYLENVGCKILVLAAEEDEIIPKVHLKNLANKFKNQLVIVEIKKANHQNIAEFSEYEIAVKKYINQLSA